jgi:hypothetical protein
VAAEVAVTIGREAQEVRLLVDEILETVVEVMAERRAQEVWVVMVLHLAPQGRLGREVVAIRMAAAAAVAITAAAAAEQFLDMQEAAAAARATMEVQKLVAQQHLAEQVRQLEEPETRHM